MDYKVVFTKQKYHMIAEMVSWCHDNIQKDNLIQQWQWNVAFGNTTFNFNREYDAMLFSLKWL